MNGPVLRDIHVPPAGWWPPGPGWWIVAAFVVAACLLLVAWLAWRRHRAPRRAALREVDTLASAFGRDGDAAKLADGASRLLRRIARRIDPAVAARGGGDWRAFLHRHARNDTARAALDQLVEARFRAGPAIDAPALLAALRAWCREALRGPGASPRRVAVALRARHSAATPFVPQGVDARPRPAGGRTAT
ncbi:MAG: DUF4381 family protein [Rhodanobacteraceae bacterium]